MDNQNVPTLFEDSNWQRCFEAYIASFKSPRTQAMYSNILYRFLKNRDPNTITKADVEAFTEVNLASATINTRVTAIRSFYRYASAYVVSGKNGRQKPLFKSANPADGMSHHNQAALLISENVKALATLTTTASNRSQSPAHIHIGHEEIPPVPIASDVPLTQRRREVLAVIINDLLGDVPALALAEGLAGNPLVIESGLFVFAGNKVMPKPLSAKNLKRMVDYFEQMGDNPEAWTCPYWRIADELASRLSREKQSATM